MIHLHYIVSTPSLYVVLFRYLPKIYAIIGLKQCPSNAWNPQSNAILERIHQVLADGLVKFDLENKPIDVNKDNPFDEYPTVVS